MLDCGTEPSRGCAFVVKQVVVVGIIAVVVAGASNVILAAACHTAGHDQSTRAVKIVRSCVLVKVIVCAVIVQVSAVLVQVSTIAFKA